MRPEFTGQLTEFVDALIASHRRYFGALPPGVVTESGEAAIIQCWSSPAIIVAHDGADDPAMIFGNRAALELWEMSWSQFIGTPSRYTAEEGARAERQRMLESARRDGFYRGYEGVRVSSTGRRFRIRDAVIWNVLNGDDEKIGQAAVFENWTRL